VNGLSAPLATVVVVGGVDVVEAGDEGALQQGLASVGMRRSTNPLWPSPVGPDRLPPHQRGGVVSVGDRSFNLAAVTALPHQVGWSMAPVELAWDVRHSHPVPTALSDYDKFRRYTAFRPYLVYRHPEQSLQDSIARLRP
jgi:hypothetical protein